MSLSRGLVRLLAVACGVTIASIYDAPPLLHTIARGFGAGQSDAGLVVTAAQAGFAAGLVLIVPLGDITARRPLFTAQVAQVLGTHRSVSGTPACRGCAACVVCLVRGQ